MCSSARWPTAARWAGLSEAALQAALLLDAAGREDVFVETVGVGQAEVDIIDHADTVVLVLMPGSGDSIQALKAGVMEIPDVIVINKADHPLTDTMVREIRGVLSLANLDRDGADAAARWRVPIVRTEAAHGRGVEELVERLEEHRAHILAAGQLAERRRRNLRGEVLALASARMRRRLEARLQGDAELERLLEEVVERRLDPASAAAALLERVGVGEEGLRAGGRRPDMATLRRTGPGCSRSGGAQRHVLKSGLANFPAAAT